MFKNQLKNNHPKNTQNLNNRICHKNEENRNYLREVFKKNFKKLAFDQLGRTPPLPPSWLSKFEKF